MEKEMKPGREFTNYLFYRVHNGIVETENDKAYLTFRKVAQGRVDPKSDSVIKDLKRLARCGGLNEDEFVQKMQRVFQDEYGGKVYNETPLTMAKAAYNKMKELLFGPEEFNSRITDARMRVGGFIEMNIDGKKVQANLPTSVFAAYQRGQVSLETIANKVLAEHDRLERETSRRYDDIQKETDHQSQERSFDLGL